MLALPVTLHHSHFTCRLLLQTTHQDAIASLQAEVQQAKEAHEALQQQLAAEQAAAAQQQEQFEALQTTLADVQAQLGEWA
jgi:predicted  nucleic acid-binding Zn-ribbon protein